MEEMPLRDRLDLQRCRNSITPRGHFPVGLNKGSGFNHSQHGAVDRGWLGDAGLSCADVPSIRVPIYPYLLTALAPQAPAPPAFLWGPLGKR